MKKSLFLFGTLITLMHARAQNDTLIITPKDINTTVLRPGTHRWLVYFQNGKDSGRISYSFWNRTISFEQYEGKDIVAIRQRWESNDTVTHTVYSVSDRKTFQPYYQESWWKGRGTTIVDMQKKTINLLGYNITDADTAKSIKRIWTAFKTSADQYTLNWHLDLETFPVLPYKEGRTFGINFYELASAPAALQYYTVTGSAKLQGYNDTEIDCWTLVHTWPNNKETFFISKKTKEVLKLEQEFNGRYRFKVKMSFSDDH